MPPSEVKDDRDGDDPRDEADAMRGNILAHCSEQDESVVQQATRAKRRRVSLKRPHARRNEHVHQYSKKYEPRNVQ